ncbi:MAG: type II secretion system F family protein [Patescibacteria group bacterium]
MPIYKFKAIDKDGNEFEDTKEFGDKAALYSYLHKIEGKMVEVNEVKKNNKPAFNFSFSRVKQQEKIAFARNLAVMIDAGLPISRALSILEKQSHRKKMKEVLQGLIASINSGQALSESIRFYKNIFPEIFVAMVKAGEESGTLSKSLKNIADQLEKAYVLAKKVKGAMIYPAIIVSLMVVIGFLMMTFMVPQLTATFQGLGVALPLVTRILIGISNFFVDYLVLILIVFALIIVGSIGFARSARGKRIIDFVVLRIPVISSIIKEVNSARTARTLSSLSASGVDIVVAVQVTKDVLQNTYYKAVLEKMSTSIEKGDTMSSIFAEAKNLYPIFVSEMTAVGEETGQMSAMLDNIANFYENEVSEKTKNLSTIIEPFLMVLIGITVGFFAIAMLAPTYALVDVIGT